MHPSINRDKIKEEEEEFPNILHFYKSIQIQQEQSQRPYTLANVSAMHCAPWAKM
jgi:hypothetical protein